MTEPIRPDIAFARKKETIPDEVFEVFNELIVENLKPNGKATFNQSDVTERLSTRGIEPKEAFDRGWLDVEGAYEDIGWYVQYDSPGYNEFYSASFTFKVRP